MTIDPFEISEADQDKLVRCIRAYLEAHRSLKACLKTRLLTPDEMEAYVDLIAVSFYFFQLLQHQRDQLDADQPVSMDLLLPAAESAMLRASALEVQLCGTSFVTQLETLYSTDQTRKEFPMLTQIVRLFVFSLALLLPAPSWAAGGFRINKRYGCGRSTDNLWNDR